MFMLISVTFVYYFHNFILSEVRKLREKPWYSQSILLNYIFDASIPISTSLLHISLLSTRLNDLDPVFHSIISIYIYLN